MSAQGAAERSYLVSGRAQGVWRASLAGAGRKSQGVTTGGEAHRRQSSILSPTSKAQSRRAALKASGLGSLTISSGEGPGEDHIRSEEMRAELDSSLAGPGVVAPKTMTKAWWAVDSGVPWWGRSSASQLA